MSIISVLIFLDKLKSFSFEKRKYMKFLIKYILIPLLFIFVFITQSIAQITFIILITIFIAFDTLKINNSLFENKKIIQAIFICQDLFYS